MKCAAQITVGVPKSNMCFDLVTLVFILSTYDGDKRLTILQYSYFVIINILFLFDEASM